MRLLADENCDFALVRALRTAGHDVLAVSELSPRAEDRQVMDLCCNEERVLITEDKDFGQLVYASGGSLSGVILLRFPAGRRDHLVNAMVDLLERHATRVAGSYTVLQPGRVRFTKLP